MKAGLLTIKDSGSWWLAVPRMGTFMKSFTRGRKAALLMIRKCKYREILRKVSADQLKGHILYIRPLINLLVQYYLSNVYILLGCKGD